MPYSHRVFPDFHRRSGMGFVIFPLRVGFAGGPFQGAVDEEYRYRTPCQG